MSLCLRSLCVLTCRWFFHWRRVRRVAGPCRDGCCCCRCVTRHVWRVSHHALSGFGGGHRAREEGGENSCDRCKHSDRSASAASAAAPGPQGTVAQHGGTQHREPGARSKKIQQHQAHGPSTALLRRSPHARQNHRIREGSQESNTAASDDVWLWCTSSAVLPHHFTPTLRFLSFTVRLETRAVKRVWRFSLCPRVFTCVRPCPVVVFPGLGPHPAALISPCEREVDQQHSADARSTSMEEHDQHRDEDRPCAHT